jgi:hypothetical protein
MPSRNDDEDRPRPLRKPVRPRADSDEDDRPRPKKRLAAKPVQELDDDDIVDDFDEVEAAPKPKAKRRPAEEVDDEKPRVRKRERETDEDDDRPRKVKKKKRRPRSNPHGHFGGTSLCNSVPLSYNAQTNLFVGLAILFAGLCVVMLKIEQPVPAIILALLTPILFLWGAAAYAKNKNYTEWLGLLALFFGFFGLLALVLMPDRSDMRRDD